MAISTLVLSESVKIIVFPHTFLCHDLNMALISAMWSITYQMATRGNSCVMGDMDKMYVGDGISMATLCEKWGLQILKSSYHALIQTFCQLPDYKSCSPTSQLKCNSCHSIMSNCLFCEILYAEVVMWVKGLGLDSTFCLQKLLCIFFLSLCRFPPITLVSSTMHIRLTGDCNLWCVFMCVCVCAGWIPAFHCRHSLQHLPWPWEQQFTQYGWMKA